MERDTEKDKKERGLAEAFRGSIGLPGVKS